MHAWAKGAERAELGAGEGESKGTQKGREGEGRYLWLFKEVDVELKDEEDI